MIYKVYDKGANIEITTNRFTVYPCSFGVDVDNPLSVEDTALCYTIMEALKKRIVNFVFIKAGEEYDNTNTVDRLDALESILNIFASQNCAIIITDILKQSPAPTEEEHVFNNIGFINVCTVLGKKAKDVESELGVSLDNILVYHNDYTSAHLFNSMNNIFE